jgi:hypothetical protein
MYWGILPQRTQSAQRLNTKAERDFAVQPND